MGRRKRLDRIFLTLIEEGKSGMKRWQSSINSSRCSPRSPTQRDSREKGSVEVRTAPRTLPSGWIKRGSAELLSVCVIRLCTPGLRGVMYEDFGVFGVFREVKSAYEAT